MKLAVAPLERLGKKQIGPGGNGRTAAEIPARNGELGWGKVGGNREGLTTVLLRVFSRSEEDRRGLAAE